MVDKFKNSQTRQTVKKLIMMIGEISLAVTPEYTDSLPDLYKLPKIISKFIDREKLGYKTDDDEYDFLLEIYTELSHILVVEEEEG